MAFVLNFVSTPLVGKAWLLRQSRAWLRVGKEVCEGKISVAIIKFYAGTCKVRPIMYTSLTAILTI